MYVCMYVCLCVCVCVFWLNKSIPVGQIISFKFEKKKCNGIDMNRRRWEQIDMSGLIYEEAEIDSWVV